MWPVFATFTFHCLWTNNLFFSSLSLFTVCGHVTWFAISTFTFNSFWTIVLIYIFHFPLFVDKWPDLQFSLSLFFTIVLIYTFHFHFSLFVDKWPDLQFSLSLLILFGQLYWFTLFTVCGQVTWFAFLTFTFHSLWTSDLICNFQFHCSLFVDKWPDLRCSLSLSTVCGEVTWFFSLLLFTVSGQMTLFAIFTFTFHCLWTSDLICAITRGDNFCEVPTFASEVERWVCQIAN